MSDTQCLKAAERISRFAAKLERSGYRPDEVISGLLAVALNTAGSKDARSLVEVLQAALPRAKALAQAQDAPPAGALH